MKPCELIGGAFLSMLAIVGASFLWWAFFKWCGVGYALTIGAVCGIVSVMIFAGMAGHCDEPVDDADDTVHLWI